MSEQVTIWHNPRCSKSRATLGILEEHGIEPEEVRYLEQSPSRAEIERVLGLLGADDPMAIVRTGEDTWKELGVDPADRDAVLDALAAHPVLIERPIVIRGDRAVIGRPPENVRSLLD
jgi:arsenate reductase (glutaredoxin)